VKLRNVLKTATKVLYILPAFFWCSVGLVAILIGGFRDMDHGFWIFPILSICAAVLLWKGKWWGALPGIVMGLLMLALVMNGLEMGLNTCVYFVLMGLVCCLASRKKGEKQ